MEIQKVAVLGAGIMGSGIVQVCAMGGFNVTMQDVGYEVMNKSLRIIEQNLQQGIERGKITKEEKENALSRIQMVIEIKDAVNDADLVIEAVPENLKLKQSVFSQAEQYSPVHTILATNTSSMSITEIASATQFPDKTIGLHFFNPVHIMKLVEIVCGLETSEETFTACAQACLKMGKQTVKINEFPGFVTTRINALIGNEAFTMLQEGLGTPEDIDKAIKLGLNHPMGPFEMVDLVGLDTRLNILEYLHRTLGEKYKPAPLMVKYVKAGRLGRKVGKGVYDYSKK